MSARRSFLGGLLVSPLAWFVPRDEPHVTRLKVLVPNWNGGRPRDNDWSHGRVLDETTGEDISRLIPFVYADRLWRSWSQRKVVNVAFFLENEKGEKFVTGNHIAKEARRVRVVCVERM